MPNTTKQSQGRVDPGMLRPAIERRLNLKKKPGANGQPTLAPSKKKTFPGLGK